MNDSRPQPVGDVNVSPARAEWRLAQRRARAALDEDDAISDRCRRLPRADCAPKAQSLTDVDGRRISIFTAAASISSATAIQGGRRNPPKWKPCLLPALLQCDRDGARAAPR